ncbi:MAG TPA: hypothetical protein VK133_00650 [Amoebophilaceae bacterium]|nr:hypothetical protein [Amoebophilaceae bacterium]
MKKVPKKIGVIMGGFTPERHVSLESGRNVYSKLTAAGVYEVLPLFLSGCIEQQRIFHLPIALLLKDNADDVHDLLLHPEKNNGSKALLASIRAEASALTNTYAQGAIFEPEELTYAALKERVDFVFIALHGRPGEDGTVQTILEQYDIPYNGSGIAAAALTMDKYATNRYLAEKGFHVADQWIATKESWRQDPQVWVQTIEDRFSYPLIVKPIDDGCSAGVAKITHSAQLLAYASAVFGGQQKNELGAKHIANTFQPREKFLVEAFIGNENESARFVETTTGLLTHVGPAQETVYEIFEPSEVLAAAEILSLEEKFLAGEGHNITPVRLHADPLVSATLRKQVRNELEKAAKVLHIQGYARIDAFVEVAAAQHTTVWIIEINTLPALTPATCIFHQCALNGYTPLAFLEAIIAYGSTKKNFSYASNS